MPEMQGDEFLPRPGMSPMRKRSFSRAMPISRQSSARSTGAASRPMPKPWDPDALTTSWPALSSVAGSRGSSTPSARCCAGLIDSSDDDLVQGREGRFVRLNARKAAKPRAADRSLHRPAGARFRLGRARRHRSKRRNTARHRATRPRGHRGTWRPGRGRHAMAPRQPHADPRPSPVRSLISPPSSATSPSAS